MLSTDVGPSVHIRTAGSQPARFWNRSRAVAPAASVFFDDHATDTTDAGNASEGDPGDDSNARDIIFISKPNSDFLDLRNMLFRSTTKQIPVGLNGAVMDVPANGPVASVTAPKRKRKPSKRRLRAKEELCLTLPRAGSRPKRSWFLSPGLIGREGGDHILVATKDPSMDPVHAEISVDGDDYLIRDHHSTGGTFLCLSTIHRHYPQRDGFRLRRGDSFFIGLTTKVTIEELVTELSPPEDTMSKRRFSGGCALGDTAPQGEIDGVEPRSSSSLRAKSTGERHLSSRMGSRSASTLGPLVESSREVETAANDDAATDKQDASKSTATLPASADSPRRRVRFSDVPPSASDGSVVRGTRYQRTRSKPKPPAYPRHRPVALTLTVTDTSEATTSSEPRRVCLCKNDLGPNSSKSASTIKDVVLLGSSTACDVHLPAEDIHPVHARIVFDGFFFILQDLSFDENPLRKTRVVLSTPTRIARGDTLLLGKCELHVTTMSKAFRGRDRDMKEVAIRCRLLRVSKRKSRAPSKYVTVGFRNQMQESFVFGKGRDCNGQVFTTALAVEQFSVQLDHGACMMTPKAAGINQGTYFLLGRDCMPHATERTPDLVRYSSKALMLVEGCVFKCGNSELEVVLVKNESGGGGGDTDRSGKNPTRSVQANDELFENTALLGNLPWLQQIAFDKKMVQNIARRGRRLAMDPGDVIYDEGDPATFLFVVVSGDAELMSVVGAGSGHSTARSDDSEPRRMTMRLESMSLVSDAAAPVPDDAQESTGINNDVVTELVPVGSFFGEICLHGPGMEYAESARASGDSGCVLLVFDREDLAGYLGMYMDIIRPHLALETEREILHCLRLHVPWLSSLSYNDMRMLVARAERLEFAAGELLIDGGRLFVPASSVLCSSPSSSASEQQQREGLLLLVRGKALLTRSMEQKPKPHKRKVSRRHSLKALVTSFAAVIDTDGDFATDSRELSRAIATNDEDEDEALGLDMKNTADDVVGMDANSIVGHDEGGEEEGEVADAGDGMQEEWWRHADPLTLLPSTAGAVNSNVVSLEARSRVECFFLDAVHVAHLATAVGNTGDEASTADAELGDQDDGGGEQETRVKPLLLRKPTNRRSSFAAQHQRLQSSQIITKGLNSASVDDEDGADDGRAHGDTDDDGPSRKWRRKKRNRNMLEKALIETQEDPELPTALVLYVLSGGNRGDVHVVRNVATLGALKSGADIELNDRYVSNSHAVIEHHDGRYWLYDDFSEWGTFVRLEENNPVEIHPGDIFLAGEVEFMCLGAFPERKKSISCCVQ